MQDADAATHAASASFPGANCYILGNPARQSPHTDPYRFPVHAPASHIMLA